MFQKILVPLDGSKQSERALKSASAMARAFQAELRLVTVEQLDEQPAPSEWDLTLGNYLDQKREGVLQHLERLADHLRAENLRVTTSVLALGPPSMRILEESRECKADLIVLFSHGRTGLSRFFMWSVAENLSRHAPCPVLIVHDESHTEKASG